MQRWMLSTGKTPFFRICNFFLYKVPPTYNDNDRLLAAQGMKKSGKRSKSQLAIGRKPLSEGGQEVFLAQSLFSIRILVWSNCLSRCS